MYMADSNGSIELALDSLKAVVAQDSARSDYVAAFERMMRRDSVDQDPDKDFLRFSISGKQLINAKDSIFIHPLLYTCFTAWQVRLSHVTSNEGTIGWAVSVKSYQSIFYMKQHIVDVQVRNKTLDRSCKCQCIPPDTECVSLLMTQDIKPEDVYEFEVHIKIVKEFYGGDDSYECPEELAECFSHVGTIFAYRTFEMMREGSLWKDQLDEIIDKLEMMFDIELYTLIRRLGLLNAVLKLLKCQLPMPGVYGDLYWAASLMAGIEQETWRSRDEIEDGKSILRAILSVIYDKQQHEHVTLYALYTILPHFVLQTQPAPTVLREMLTVLADEAGDLLQYYHEPLYQLFYFRCGRQIEREEDARLSSWSIGHTEFFTLFSLYLLSSGKLLKLSRTDATNVLRTIIKNKLDPIFAFHNDSDTSFTFVTLTKLMFKHNFALYDLWLELILEHKDYNPFLFDLLVTSSTMQNSIIAFCDLFNESKLKFDKNFPLFYELFAQLFEAFVKPLKDAMNGKSNEYSSNVLKKTLDDAMSLYNKDEFEKSKQKYSSMIEWLMCSKVKFVRDDSGSGGLHPMEVLSRCFCNMVKVNSKLKDYKRVLVDTLVCIKDIDVLDLDKDWPWKKEKKTRRNEAMLGRVKALYHLKLWRLLLLNVLDLLRKTKKSMRSIAAKYYYISLAEYIKEAGYLHFPQFCIACSKDGDVDADWLFVDIYGSNCRRCLHPFCSEKCMADENHKKYCQMVADAVKTVPPEYSYKPVPPQ